MAEHMPPQALQNIYRSIFGSPQTVEELEHSSLGADIAHLLKASRSNAGLSHLELARRVGTNASTISRFEDPEFNGHSLFILDRLAMALDCRLQIRFIPKSR